MCRSLRKDRDRHVIDGTSIELIPFRIGGEFARQVLEKLCPTWRGNERRRATESNGVG